MASLQGPGDGADDLLDAALDDLKESGTRLEGNSDSGCLLVTGYRDEALDPPLLWRLDREWFRNGTGLITRQAGSEPTSFQLMLDDVEEQVAAEVHRRSTGRRPCLELE